MRGLKGPRSSFEATYAYVGVPAERVFGRRERGLPLAAAEGFIFLCAEREGGRKFSNEPAEEQGFRQRALFIFAIHYSFPLSDI